MKNKWIWHFQQLTAGEQALIILLFHLGTQIFTAKSVSKSKLRWSSLRWGHVMVKVETCQKILKFNIRKFNEGKFLETSWVEEAFDH